MDVADSRREHDSMRGAEPRSRFDPRFARVFAWIAERMLRKSFTAIRLEHGSHGEVEALQTHAGPILLLLNHPSWWDPLIVAFLRRRFFPTRAVVGPMDAHELERFGVFKRLGVFGIDPDDPASARRLRAEMANRLADDPRVLAVMTPQGRLTDVREPTRVRPGAALILDNHPQLLASCVAVEYPFWSAKRPEVLLRIRRVAPPTTSGARSWQHEIVHAMESNRTELAALAMARRQEAFDSLLAGASRGGPYAWWLRLSGRGNEIDAARRRREASA